MKQTGERRTPIRSLEFKLQLAWGTSQSLNSGISLAHFKPRHGFPVELVEKISPRNEKRIVFRNLPGVFVSTGGELFRFAQENNGLRRQIIQESGE